MKRLALAFVLSFSPTAALAEHVLFYSDSIGSAALAVPTIYDLFIAQKPGWTGCNDSYPGRQTDSAFLPSVQRGATDITAAMEPRCPGVETDVIVMLGINDPLEGPGVWRDAKETAKRLRTIAGKIKNRGATPWIVPPLPCPTDRYIGFDFQQYRKDVRYWLGHLNGAGTTYNIVDAPDEFTELLWSSCATDLVHPDGIACRQKVADYLAESIP